MGNIAFIGGYFHLRINTHLVHYSEYLEQHNSACGIDSKTTVPMFVVMKEHVTQCSRVDC